MTETTWKGEEQTLDCLRKIMSKVSQYPYIVVKGNIQSGKSSLMKYFAAYMIKESMNVVIILRNIKDDVESMKIKLTGFRDEKGFEYDIICVSDIKTSSDLKYQMTCKNKIFLLEGNSTQIAKFNKFISEKTRPLAMEIDELDLNTKDETTKFQVEFTNLLSSGKISQILGITGTALPIFFKKGDLNKEQIISLESPTNYKGIHNITITNIDITDENIIEKTLLKMLDSDYAFFDKDGKKHPAIILIKDEHVKSKQQEQMKKLHENVRLKKHFCIIKHNGDGVEISMCGNKKLPLKKKKISINEALQRIKDLNDYEIKYIAIIAGNLASRGLSYVSTDYGWHLTHELLNCSSNTTGTIITQACRLCGCYSDDIPLEMFTSLEISKELKAYDKLQERIVERCEDDLVEPEKLDEVMRNITFDKTCVIGRQIDTKIKARFSKISNYNKIMCGEKLTATSLQHAKESLRKTTCESAKVVIKKVKMKEMMEFNAENCEKMKKYFKGKGKNVQILPKNRLNLLKHPDFITKTQQTADYFIADVNGFISIFEKTRDEIDYGQLIIFEVPNGIYSARGTNGDKEELESMLSNKYKLNI